MSTLGDLAKGRPCDMRLPNVCNWDTTTTVLAHINRGGISGMLMKAPDVCSVFACSNCHDAVDRRSTMGGYTKSDLDSYILEGHLRTLAWLWREGHITCS